MQRVEKSISGAEQTCHTHVRHWCAQPCAADCATAQAPSLVSRGYTALQVAAGNGHDSTVELLLTRKADIGAKSRNGPAP